MITTLIEAIERRANAATEGLADFVREVDTQDNRATARPILFELQTKRRIPADPRTGRYSEKAKDCDWLSESPECLGLHPEETIYWEEIWETRAVFFTLKGLQEHLEMNRHNYGEYRDYVVHAFRNPEMVRVHSWLRESVQATADIPALCKALRRAVTEIEALPCGSDPNDATHECYRCEVLADIEKELRGGK